MASRTLAAAGGQAGVRLRSFMTNDARFSVLGGIKVMHDGLGLAFVSPAIWLFTFLFDHRQS